MRTGSILTTASTAARPDSFHLHRVPGRVLCGMALAACVVAGPMAGCSRGPDVLAFEEAAGYRLGQVVAESSGADGPVLVLRSPTPLDSDEATASRCRGLRKALSGRQVMEAGPDLLGLGAPSGDFHVLPGEEWASRVGAWCREYPDAVAVVSLLFDFPPLGDAAWGKDLPPLYGFNAGPSRAWVGAMKRGRLKALVLYKSEASHQEALPRGATPGEVFDQRFKLVMPD